MVTSQFCKDFRMRNVKMELFYHGKKNQKQHFLTQRFFTNNRRVFVFASKNVFKTYFKYSEGYAFLMPQKNSCMVEGFRSWLPMKKKDIGFSFKFLIIQIASINTYCFKLSDSFKSPQNCS